MTTPPPRRLSRNARLRQLVAAAMPLAARQGLAGLSLEDLAGRAGVTRNLLYHYFPRGRADVAVSVIQEAERQLGSSSRSDNAVAAMIDHALAPTHAWLIHRMASVETDPEVRGIVARIAEERVQALLSSHPPREGRGSIMEVSIRGYLGFAEAALDRARVTGLPRTELVQLLDQMRVAALDAARL